MITSGITATFYAYRIRGFFSVHARFRAPSGPKLTQLFFWEGVLKITQSQDARTDAIVRKDVPFIGNKTKI